MTDETTARDRAIKDMTVALTPYLGDRIFGLPQTPDAVLAAVWPLVERYAQDEVLRALAAAPTADVAELSHLPVAHSGCPATAGGRCIVPGEHPDHGPAAAPERDAARAEVQVLRRDVVQHEATIRYLVDERERTRARAEAAKAVVQAWRANEAAPFEGTTPALFDLLDALARAYEGGGQDR